MDYSMTKHHGSQDFSDFFMQNWSWYIAQCQYKLKTMHTTDML